MPKAGSKNSKDNDKHHVAHNQRALDSVERVYKNYPTPKRKAPPTGVTWSEEMDLFAYGSDGKKEIGLSDYSKEVNQMLKRFGVMDESGKATSSVIHKPRSRINVMIVGNHSAGKSSFINWYVGKPGLLKTSMAIETKGITFVAHGAKDDEYGSDGTLRKFPEIVNIAEETGDPNIVANLSTQLSTSGDRLFPLVTFIDTPGLVDTTEYPFKVNEGIEAMSEYCDKVLVFMDPMGKATCSRTMDVIKLLQEKCPSKTGFYLTKADSIDNQRDAMNVALQICKDMGNATNRVHNFKMPCIYLPSDDEHKDHKENAVTNAIGDLCASIAKCTQMKAQSNMSRLKKDSTFLLQWIDTLQKMDIEKKSAKSCRLQISRTLWMIVLSMVILSFLWVLVTFQSIVPDAITEQPLYGEIVTAVKPWVGSDEESSSLGRVMSFAKFVGTFFVFTFMASFVGSRANGYPTLTGFDLEKLNQIKIWVADVGTKESDRIWERYQGTVDGMRD